MIDPHVHCRDGTQSHKETIAHVFKICDEQGVKKIFDMPNTEPPILTEQDARARLRLVPPKRKKDYYLYMGATADEVQLERAVRAYHKLPWVVGFKLYAGKSTGNLAVLEERNQRMIYRTLGKLGYAGVLVVHCEKERYMKNNFDPSYPKNHAFNRPPRAEIESLKDQIRFAAQEKFKGRLHIAHVSCPESVLLVAAAKKKMKITCGVTPHHLLWDETRLEGPDGLFYKCNPPLRDKKRVRKLRLLLKKGAIDWIETDHAPHALGEKFMHPYMSGYPSLYLYKFLRDQFMPSLGMTRRQIRNVTYLNIIKAFKSKLI